MRKKNWIFTFSGIETISLRKQNSKSTKLEYRTNKISKILFAVWAFLQSLVETIAAANTLWQSSLTSVFNVPARLWLWMPKGTKFMVMQYYGRGRKKDFFFNIEIRTIMNWIILLYNNFRTVMNCILLIIYCMNWIKLLHSSNVHLSCKHCKKINSRNVPHQMRTLKSTKHVSLSFHNLSACNIEQIHSL